MKTSLTRKGFFLKYYEFDNSTGKTFFNGNGAENRHIFYVSDLIEILTSVPIEGVMSSDVETIFGAHGFYLDADGDGEYTKGEVIQVQTSAYPERRKFMVPQGSILIIDSESQSQDGKILVQVMFSDPFSSYGYEYSVPVARPRVLE